MEHTCLSLLSFQREQKPNIGLNPVVLSMDGSQAHVEALLCPEFRSCLWVCGLLIESPLLVAPS